MLRQFVAKARQRLRGHGKTNAEIFDQIYRDKSWRGKGEISSGLGSNAENSSAYEDYVVGYILENGVRSIVDVGCGDFQVSARILARVPDRVTYIGVDVSQLAVDHNQRKFGSDRVRFVCADAATDPLPEGDLGLVREVLQHLSNADIAKILPKLEKFPHALVTNTVKLGANTINFDIPTGSASRAALGSGLWLDKAPFHRSVEQVLGIRHGSHSTEIITVRLLPSS
jgi:SAM-dependent methyltransferase